MASKGAAAGKSGKKGPMLNGFYTMPEPPCLEVKPESIAAQSLPIEAFSFTPAQDAIVTLFKNGDKERKIYCNIELSDLEKEQLKKLQDEANKQGLEFLPSITIMATRFLSRARGDPQKAIKLMLATQEWRLSYFKAGPIHDSDVAEDMQHGIVYFCGRDAALRPIIVVRATRIPAQWYKEKRIDKLIRVLIFSMEYMIRYMVLPGTIENNILIVDLKGLGLSQVPLSALSEIYGVMSHHYIGRVYKFYICNMSYTLSTIAGMAKNILTDRQKQKLVFVDNIRDVLKDVAAHQLEEDLGGTRPIIKQFFPYPLQAGPFGVGSTQNPAAAVPRAHEVLTEAGMLGRLWNPAHSKQENCRLEYTDQAVQWFKDHNQPVPADCQRQHEVKLAAEQRAKEIEANPELAVANAKEQEVAENIANSEEECAGQAPEVETATAQEVDDIVVQDPEIRPRGFFSCRPCWCAPGH